MGTRNLTCVVYNGEYKLARYSQWDGYRESLGAGVLNFLRTDFNRERFIAGLEKLKVASSAQLKQFWADAGADPKCDWVTLEVSGKFESAHPELSRNPASHDILKLIQDGGAKWSNPDINFAADSLFCEWAYVIDLDKNTFEIYEGFNQTPLNASERFASLPLKKSNSGEKYYPVRLLKSYSLRRLPTPATMCKVPSWSSRRERSNKSKTV